MWVVRVTLVKARFTSHYRVLQGDAVVDAIHKTKVLVVGAGGIGELTLRCKAAEPFAPVFDACRV